MSEYTAEEDYLGSLITPITLLLRRLQRLRCRNLDCLSEVSGIYAFDRRSRANLTPGSRSYIGVESITNIHRTSVWSPDSRLVESAGVKSEEEFWAFAYWVISSTHSNAHTVKSHLFRLFNLRNTRWILRFQCRIRNSAQPILRVKTFPLRQVRTKHSEPSFRSFNSSNSLQETKTRTLSMNGKNEVYTRRRAWGTSRVR